MTGLSRCGKRYPDLDSALRAAEGKTFRSGRPWITTGCRTGQDHWHVIERVKQSRPDPFPPAVARLLDLRDEHCQRCGATGVRLERHHRRAKASGGSGARAHTACCCNGLRLCRGCHAWTHEHPAAARLEGFIVRQSVAEPSRQLVSRATEAGQERSWWRPTCDGQWWPLQVSACTTCGRPGRYGFDDDWCHEEMDAATSCPREGWYVGKDDEL